MLQKDLLLPWRTALAQRDARARNPRRAARRGATSGRVRCWTSWACTASPTHYPSTLSGGMRQRVALARTLVNEPEVLLLDEPFASLDFQTKLLIESDTARLVRSQRRSLLLITHDIEEAVSLSDRVIVLQPAADPDPGGLRYRARRRPDRHDGGARQPRLHRICPRDLARSRGRPRMSTRRKRSAAMPVRDRRRTPASIARRTAGGMRGDVLVLACQLLLLAVLLGLWEYATARNKQAAFLFGSPSAIGGFLVKMWQDGSLVRDTWVTGLETCWASSSATSSARVLGLSLWYSRFVSRVVQPFIIALGLDPDHRAGADRHHLVRHRARLEDRDVDPVGGDRGAGHLLQGRDERRSRPDQSDADAGRHQRADLPQAGRAGLARPTSSPA